ncbi:MAG: hypothetical protein K2Y51_18890 [Gammaproteobacteria bacterium]|nr:hypothetical protein [Gammaproteobacteria bacterium]
MLEAFGGLMRRRRFELLEHLECMKSRRLRLDHLVVAGVPYRASADEVPLERVVAVRARATAARGALVRRDDAGWSEALHGLQSGEGWLLLEGDVALALSDGEVRGFELQAPVRRHFCYIRSYVDLLHLFGLPDAVHTRCGDDGPVAHTLSYHRQHKRIVWDCRADALVVARLGDFGDGPRVRRPPRGGHGLRVKPRSSLGIPPLPGAPAWGLAFQAG